MIVPEFSVEAAAVEPYAAVPTLRFDLGVSVGDDVDIQSILLHAQVRIEPQKRGYDVSEESLLVELFGERDRWSKTLQPFPWTQMTTTVRTFTGSTTVPLPVPCSYELEVAAAKYFHALGPDGAVPLLFLFNGSVFARDGRGVQVTQVPWDCEARFDLPVRTWRELMDAYYPDQGWLRLPRETIEELTRFKSTRGLLSWDEVVRALLHESRTPAGGEA